MPVAIVLRFARVGRRESCHRQVTEEVFYIFLSHLIRHFVTPVSATAAVGDKRLPPATIAPYQGEGFSPHWHFQQFNSKILQSSDINLYKYIIKKIISKQFCENFPKKIPDKFRRRKISGIYTAFNQFCRKILSSEIGVYAINPSESKSSACISTAVIP